MRRLQASERERTDARTKHNLPSTMAENRIPRASQATGPASVAERLGRVRPPSLVCNPEVRKQADAYRHGMNADIPDRRQPATPVHGAYDTDATRPVAATNVSLHDEVLSREEQRFGGFKFGSAFFGWLTAMGLTVLLTALIAAIGAAIGLYSPETAEDAASAAAENVGTTTIIGAIALGLVLFVSYFAGGYVAGRMARFSGLKQGLAVWLWAIVMAIVVAVITAIAGSQWDIFANLGGVPRIPVTPETATTTGILTALGVAVVTLGGALLGGVAGMRYHRRVDREGLGA
jgi:hypothetical protein